LNTLERLEKRLLHGTGKAIADYNLIQSNDKILVCLSGGKDSFTMLHLLRKLQQRAKVKFELFAFTLDQSQPGWDDKPLKAWLTEHDVQHEILKEDTYSIVTDIIPEGKTYCSLCSRLRRGIIYRYAEKHQFTKIALGHHRDDLITSLLMSIFYNGEIKSMPPKLLSDNKKNIVIRPLAYCQEKDIAEFAQLKEFPIIPCRLCGSQANLARQKTQALIETLAKENPNIPNNMLHALQSVKPSQLMDRQLWDFSFDHGNGEDD
jgi:tRNA 2-thiocytidine biosynthesis protein TtcA